MKTTFKYNFQKLRYLWILVPVLIFSSCEKDITVDLPEPEEKVVVEGYITPGQNAYVFVSRTTAFFAPTDSNALLASAEKNALITITDGFSIDTMVALSQSIGYVYVAPNMTGVIGRTYLLRVETTDGHILTSVTSIPQPVPLDSIWFELQGQSDSLGWIKARLNDPPLIKNNYRWFAKRLGKDDDFITPSGSVFEDRFFDGLSFDFVYNRGEPPYSTAEEDDPDNPEDGFYKIGDTLVVKFASITPESYEFWRAAETQAVSNGNPFGSPAPLKSNIVGGIGIWEGFSFTLDTTIAQ